MSCFIDVTDETWTLFQLRRLHPGETKGGAFDLPSVSSIWTMNSTLCSLQQYLQQSPKESNTLWILLRIFTDLAVQLAANRKSNVVSSAFRSTLYPVNPTNKINNINCQEASIISKMQHFLIICPFYPSHTKCSLNVYGWPDCLDYCKRRSKRSCNSSNRINLLNSKLKTWVN